MQRAAPRQRAVTTPMLDPSYHPGVVALSLLVAAFASYVALDLAHRVRATDRLSAAVWRVGGALAMGTGIWSMHFIGMLAYSLPIPIGYAALTTFASWLAAVAVSALALCIAARERLSASTLLAGAAAMGGGICAMHYIGMAALDMAPGIVWDAGWVATSGVIACAASAAALLIFFGMRRLHGLRFQLAQAGAAVLMGAAISGMHYAGMAAASFPVGSVCLSAGGLGGQNLVTMVVLATLVLLSITLITSVLDARLRAQAKGLALSLQTANQQLQCANAELQRRALLDPLTGVPNRFLFEDRLLRAAARVDRALDGPNDRGPRKLGLLFVDLDGFKPVNDSYGHAAGDAVLKQVAQRLSLVGRETDTLARIGGDEFVLLLEEVSGVPDAVSLARRVLSSMNQPFDLPERKVTLSCSVGVAVYPDHAHRDKLLGSADAAMYTAKRAGGACYAVYEAHMQDHAAEQLDLQQALRDALSSGQLQLHYQPKIATISGRVCGVEALLRWTHPVRGPISPAVFIPVAERFGLIVPIGNWVIDEVCAQIAEWAAGGRRLRVALNLSAYQLRQTEVADHLQQAMFRHGIDAGQIVCEITESVVMEDTRATQAVLDRLSALGVKLSIDDFGTGYSSLAYLRQLRAHELKIDRSFVKDVATNGDARAVVDAVVHLAHALGLRVVAEGVETREQRDVLTHLRCDEMQGYFFARPMSAGALMKAGLLTSDGAERVEFSASAFMAA